jgi:hypothetical protein
MWNSTLVARLHGLAELRLVDGHEKYLFRLGLLRHFRRHADGPGRLSHSLDQENARIDRARREMAGELRLVEGDVLDADAGIVAVDLDDPVDQEERVAVRQQFENPHDVGALKRGGRFGHDLKLRMLLGVAAGYEATPSSLAESLESL